LLPHFPLAQQPTGYVADCFTGFDGSAGCWLVVDFSGGVTVLSYFFVL
jgi:hypothetical protein